MFEATQRQWELVMGMNPSFFTNPECYAARPAECVSYNMIAGRAGNGLTAQHHAMKYSGFIGWVERLLREPPFMERLRRKTGLPFRLPSEAQWEYACRAGSGAAPNPAPPSVTARALPKHERARTLLAQRRRRLRI